MNRLPKRYRFDNHLPAPREPAHLPVEPQAGVGEPTPEQAPQVIHVHEAPRSAGAGKWIAAGLGGSVVLLAVAVSAVAIAIAAVAITVCVVVLYLLVRDLRNGGR